MRSCQKRRVSRTTEGEADWAIAALHVPEIQTSPAISRLIHELPSPPSPPVAPLALAPPPHKLARVCRPFFALQFLRQCQHLLEFFSDKTRQCHHLVRLSGYSGRVVDISN